MFPQLEEEICNVGGKSVWAVPVKDSNGGASVDDGVPKVNFRRGEVKDGGNTEGNEAKGLKVRE